MRIPVISSTAKSSRSPMSTKPTVAMDTSALKWLVREADPEPIIAVILSGYDGRIPEMTYETL